MKFKLKTDALIIRPFSDCADDTDTSPSATTMMMVMMMAVVVTSS
jgi:hypothetical protein